MSPIVALLLALAKAVPDLRVIADQFAEGWAAYQRDQNIKAQAAKDARNDAAVDAAAGGVPVGGGPAAPGAGS